MNSAERQRRLHLVIYGLVQGVGFRFFVEQQARELGLTGWVRNLTNGAVEVLAEGPSPALARLAEACRRGPRSAVVDRVEEHWHEPTGEFRRFDIRPTAACPL
ncbi:MAG: acylphosphatase [Candidatus Binatia bacterium]|nr:acylphosphatase [Candidatus Binatia bacterium]